MTNIKTRIAASLIELLHTQPLDLISISELCNHAHVGRTSFYNNFSNKEDALKYQYRKAYEETFKDKLKNIDYLLSDLYIKDTIHFFDVNSDLLKVIHKWSLIDIITKYNTELASSYVKLYQDDFIRRNADYFVCFTGVLIFNTCTLWILKDKNISADELFKMIQYFQSLSK